MIPKKTIPESMDNLRNISCTALPSKIYESYVLNWTQEEVSTKSNQYVGVKNCSTAHFLVQVWDEIARTLEDDRAASLLTSIDYAKAFNRLSFQHCLSAFARKGASTPLLELLATFLSNRTMAVRVDQAWSDPRQVTGGVPQGSILGDFLFNIATDDLEDLDDGEGQHRVRPGSSSSSGWTSDSSGEEAVGPVSSTPSQVQSQAPSAPDTPGTPDSWAPSPLWKA